MIELQEVIDGLRQVVDDINNTGGLVTNSDGLLAPKADETWTDLADTYLKACTALGLKPLIDQ